MSVFTKKAPYLAVLIAFFSIFASKIATAAPIADSIKVEDAYVRLVPSVSKTTAAFMTLTNQSEMESALIRAEGDTAESIELHAHIHDQGVMRMRRIDEIKLPANSSVKLEPGGLHIMFIGLKAPLAADQMVKLTLVFSDESKKELELPVQGMAKQGHQHHHH